MYLNFDRDNIVMSTRVYLVAYSKGRITYYLSDVYRNKYDDNNNKMLLMVLNFKKPSTKPKLL